MIRVFTRTNRLATWFETTTRPGWVLAGVILLLLGWTLPGGFVIDDYRHLRLMQDYRAGRITTLDLYRFLRNDSENHALRAGAYYPWWVGDDVRYQHFRPLAEWFLYGEYRLFGPRPVGFRAASLALYITGSLLAMRLFREFVGDEPTARWAALFYAVAACHAAPAMFVSMQCDLLALILVSASMLAMARFIRSGGFVTVGCAVLFFGLALGTKESALPVAVLPLVLGTLVCEKGEDRRRAVAGSALLMGTGACWLTYYAVSGYGSNIAVMLDPFHAPLQYVAELPGRITVLLATWLVPVNPFFFYLRPFGRPWIVGFAFVGLVTLCLMGWLVRRVGARAAAMSIWVLAFLPLLACTVPDDRNMLLPSMGFAVLGALWLRLPARRPAAGRRHLPLILFAAAQIPAFAGTAVAMRFMETQSREALEGARTAFGRPTAQGDYIFFLNACYDWQLLFGQYCFETLHGAQSAKVVFLSDVRHVVVNCLDARTLRIEAAKDPLISGFLGAMGEGRSRKRHEGDEYDAGEFKSRIARMKNGEVWAIEVRFARPLDDDAYRFFWCRIGRPPEPVKLSGAESFAAQGV